MSTCNIKFNDEYPEVDYDLEGSVYKESLVINCVDMDGEGPKNFEEFTDDEQEEITMKVLKYLEELDDWNASEVDEECTRRMEARMEANWSK
jgi:hypothetical protein